jgi:TP901 family phage tail tape measure protein
MATGFSVFVNIGGKVSPSLNAAVNAAKSQVNGLAASLAKIGAAPAFAAVNKHLAETSKRMAAVQRHGRNLAMTVTAPAAFAGASMFRPALDRDKAGNSLEAIGGATRAQRLEIEKFAESISAKYGSATDVLKTFTSMLKGGFDLAAARGAVDSVMKGAVLSDGDLTASQLGDEVSKIATQFALNMSSVEKASASTRRIVDNLVYGGNATAASVKQMAEAYKFVGAAASAAGASVESTNALIIGLAKAGQLGSEGGVALRSAFVRLVKPTKGGRATMARLGLDYGSYVTGGSRTGAGVAAGLSASGFDMSGSERAIDKALANNQGNTEAQRKAIYDVVVTKFGAEAAQDRQKVLEAVDAAFSLAGSKIDLTKLLIDLKKKGATQGDLANIFEGRQSVRMLSLLKADLEGILKDINENATGYSDKRFDTKNQGLEAVVKRMSAAWESFNVSIVSAVQPEITGMMERLASAVKNLAATSPALLKSGVYLAAAAAAAGPLLFILGAVGRVGLLALRGLNFAAMALLAPIGMLARGIVGVGAVALAAMARVRAMAAGLLLLNAVGGGGAVLAAIGGGLLAFGRAVLLFPLTALRAIGLAMWALVANPVGLIIGGLVAALAALGVWVYNNWSGIKEFFAGFGEGFMKGLGPAGGAIKSMADGLGSVVNWLGQLLGPLDESGSKWRSWGETVGGVVTKGVQLVAEGIQKLIGFLGTVVSKAGEVGGALKGMFSWKAWGGAAAAPAVPLAGARALGGPVTYGRPYLVGERGPELFIPGASGHIETNNTLRRLTADGTAAVAATESRNVRGGPINIQNHWTINGADDPRAVAAQVEAHFAGMMRRLESEQRGLLSD